MPITLAVLQKKAVRVECEYDGEKFWVDYLPHKMDEAAWGHFRAWISPDEHSNTPLAAMLVTVLSEWDILANERGGKLPITEANLLALPRALLLVIANAVMGDMNKAKP